MTRHVRVCAYPLARSPLQHRRQRHNTHYDTNTSPILDDAILVYCFSIICVLPTSLLFSPTMSSCSRSKHQVVLIWLSRRPAYEPLLKVILCGPLQDRCPADHAQQEIVHGAYLYAFETLTRRRVRSTRRQSMRSIQHSSLWRAGYASLPFSLTVLG